MNLLMIALYRYIYAKSRQSKQPPTHTIILKQKIYCSAVEVRRLYEKINGSYITWDLVEREDNGAHACAYKNFQEWFCVPVSASTFEIIDWKISGEQGNGQLKYLSMVYGTKETYLQVHIAKIDIKEMIIINEHPCSMFVITSVYEDEMLGSDTNFLKSCE